MSKQLDEAVARLAAGSKGSAEAVIQSDVRLFLLLAKLDLNESELSDVQLESQAGGGRRIDVETGTAVIEVKKSLAAASVLEPAREQLAGYVRQRTEELGQRYVGILTDGQIWLLHHLMLDGTLREVGRFELRTADQGPQLAAWLESVLATVEQVTPTPREILRNLGAGSPAFALDLTDLEDLYAACRDHPEVKLKRELWSRLLTAALGTNFEDSDELFVTHTYLVLTAELIAHAVAGVPYTEGQDTRALLEGEQFNKAGLHGVVEADFFDWPALAEERGTQLVRAIARRLARFDWSQVEHDLLKVLYESVIDADTRHKLGEYYTPDWLAQHMVDDHIDQPLEQRVLDPACGSGTFLFWAARRLLEAADQAGMSNHDALALLVDRVFGIDLHPVAVTLARVTYLLAIGRERLDGRPAALTIPVYLGDSIRWEQDATLLRPEGLTINTASDQAELVDDELHFPEAVLEDPQRFDRLVADLAHRAANRTASMATGSSRSTKKTVPSIDGILNAHKVAAATDRAAVETVFEKLCRLHDAGRNHIWGYYIRNLARPLSFTRPAGRVDVLVGNPPWLAYRHMPAQLQTRYQELAKPRGLWAGGKVATHQDLSDLFVVRAVEQYLRPDGTFAFVMPYAVLSRRQYAGFRSGQATSQSGGVRAIAFSTPEEYARVKPPLFPVPACVVAGRPAKTPSALVDAAVSWTGKITDHHAGWTETRPQLTRSNAQVAIAHDAAESPYRARFRQGATMVPRVLLSVEDDDAPPLGLPAGTRAVRSHRTANEKEPWKSLPSLSGLIEEQFVHPMHLGETILAHRARNPLQAVVPHDDEGLMDGRSDRLDRYPNLAAWWRQAEKLWEAHKSARSTLTLRQQVDFQTKLTKQFPIAGHRVVYTKSGQHLAACIISDPEAIIDHTLYWAAVDSIDEGRYLTAILNSRTLAEAVVALQARGQHNPRHFDMHVFALGFPAYDPDDQLHRRLAELAESAEHAAVALPLDDARQFQKARRAVREHLAAAGIANAIDTAVADLLAATASA